MVVSLMQKYQRRKKSETQSLQHLEEPIAFDLLTVWGSYVPWYNCETASTTEQFFQNWANLLRLQILVKNFGLKI